jgi:hypothetical protein
VNIVILNWQRPLWEGDQKVVKRSGRDESVWVAVCKCMEATLGIFLYRHLYLKLVKTLSFLLLLMFSLQQNQRRGGQNGFCCWGWEGRWHKQTMYTHVSKCKNDKIKGENKFKIKRRNKF